ncbi:MAG: hypothetical protein K1Y01_06560 [Vicinamibacteria bacterium]|nr:hypothetical protein [Vicinamibacteria bacterium]
MKRVARRGRRPSPRFSVAAVLRNEGQRLPRLLASLAPFREAGGEIMILDTGSDDGTPRLAAEAGCRVEVEPVRFNGRLTAKDVTRIERAFGLTGAPGLLERGQRVFDLGAARNHVASLAKHDLVLQVDGSDVLEAFDVEYLDAAVQAGGHDVFKFETRRLHGERWFAEHRDYFADRRAARWYGRAHCFVKPMPAGTALRMTVIPPDRLRVTHHTDGTKTRDHQFAGVALDLLASPEAPDRRFLLGRELAMRGAYRPAIEAFLAVDRTGVPNSLRASTLSMAAVCQAALSPGDEDAVSDLLFKAMRRDPSRRDPLLHLARRRLAVSDFQGAVSFATAALTIPARVGLSESEENLRHGPHAILYWALFWLGRRDEARRHFEICVKQDPGNRAYREHAKLFA